jgi:hypothetical protein
VEGYTLLGGMLRDCLSRPLSGLKNTADGIYRGLDIEFIKEEILHLIKVDSRPVTKVLKQFLFSRNVSKP